VIWLDFERFGDRMSAGDIGGWLGERVLALRDLTTAPILVMDWDGETSHEEFADRFRQSSADAGAVFRVDRSEFLGPLGDDYFDTERAGIVGTRVSRRGAVQVARMLGSRWLPGVLLPRLKAVVVDLDNTIYGGVLGEDGPDGVILSEGHAELQRELLAVKDSGLFLAAVSRNHPDDVETLFSARSDFPLNLRDFSAVVIGWQSKADGLEEVARALRIDPEAMLFVDDNPGELLEVAQRFAAISCLHADEDARRTALGVRLFPGIWSPSGTAEDTLRIEDMRANQERERLLVSAPEDQASYYRELRVKLTVVHNAEEQMPRFADLSRKTNQFNLAFRRYPEHELRSALQRGQWQLSTTRLEDRLSDSGVIAIAVAERQGPTLLVHEVCISCRALGRKLEDVMVAQMLASGPLFAGATAAVFTFVDGPRNQPARAWLSSFANCDLPPASEPLHVTVPAGRIADAASASDLGIEIRR